MLCGAGPDVPLNRHPDLDLCSTSVWHIHYPCLTGSAINSGSIWQGMHHGFVYKKAVGDVGGVTLQRHLQSGFCQDKLLIYVQCLISSFTCKNLLLSINNYSKWD